jgi:hypothetical protein
VGVKQNGAGHFRSRQTSRPLPRTFSTLERAQGELGAWIDDYSVRRPHQSLKMATPAERFHATRPTTPTLPLDLRIFNEDRSGDGWVSRTVSINGVISISNQMLSVSKQRSEKDSVLGYRIACNAFNLRIAPRFNRQSRISANTTVTLSGAPASNARSIRAWTA